ncbi:MAG: esterase-like activity of phytase family protein [Erythrobacter sp.]
MKRRLIALTIVALGLAPGTWVRTEQVSHKTPFTFAATPIQTEHWSSRGFTLKRAWRLDSAHPDFGGFSALLHFGDGQFLAGSDNGYLFRFRLGENGPADGVLNRIGPSSARSKTVVDLESLMLDPQSGQFWAGFEGSNTIVRYAADDSEEARANPAEMAHWSANSGSEVMARLDDGRTIVIAEQQSGMAGGGHEALLFPGDPTLGQAPAQFVFSSDASHRPTGMVITPDGRALMVLRRFDPFDGYSFSIVLAVADPANIRAESDWPVQEWMPLDASLPLDNFEGVALGDVQADGHTCRVWMVSDDNFSAFQDTLLVEFEWDHCGGPNDTQTDPN